MSVRRIIVLAITDDADPCRPWWEALSLPPPERWNGDEGFPQPGVYVDELHEWTLIGYVPALDPSEAT